MTCPYCSGTVVWEWRRAEQLLHLAAHVRPEQLVDMPPAPSVYGPPGDGGAWWRVCGHCRLVIFLQGERDAPQPQAQEAV